MRLRPFSAFALLGAATACVAESSTPALEPTDHLIRPSAVQMVALEATEHAFSSEGDLSVASLPNGLTLLGGSAGLFELQSQGPTLIDPTPILGLAALDDLIAVARPDGLFVFDGSLAESPINDVLEGVAITALASDGSALFIGTDAALWRLFDGTLESFDDLLSVTAIDTFVAADQVVVTADGHPVILRPDAEGWLVQDLFDEGPDRVVPGPGGRLFALFGDALSERVDLSDAVSYRPVAVTMTDEVGATGVLALTVDPTTGFVWVVDREAAYRIETAEGRVSFVPRAATEIASATASSGALFVSDGAMLARIGNEGPPLRFDDTIRSFADQNCARCHGSGIGVAHELASLAQWTDEIETIIQQLEAGTMPQDGQPLRGGTIDTVKRWQADGFLP